MSKLRLPRLSTPPRRSLPPEMAARLARAGKRRSPAVSLGRREFLKAAGVILAALATPLGPIRRAYARRRRPGGFFTREQWQTLEALVDRIIPPDGQPGAKAMGAADYIEGLLTAFDGPGVPRIFAGGPFSNRNPFPNNGPGRPGPHRPENSFRNFIPLTRLQELRWRAEIFGSESLPGVNFNDAAFGGPLRGLRDVYREGLARVNEVALAVAGARFADLPPERQDEVLDVLDTPGVLERDPRREMTFLDIVIEHTLEGCFSAPEYGGNRRRRGWKLIRLKGDVQPLGYSIYSRREGRYHERRRWPMSRPNPDEVGPDGKVRPRPLSPDGERIQEIIVIGANALSAIC